MATHANISVGTRNNPQSNAFTLVELLVVIAIISVLAGMLLPALEEAVDSARTIKCANNMRQMNMLMQAFESDQNAICPSLYITNYPEGVNGYNLPSDIASTASTKYILRWFGYIETEGNFIADGTWSFDANADNYWWKMASEQVADTIFSCPNMRLEPDSVQFYTAGSSTLAQYIQDDQERRRAPYYWDWFYANDDGSYTAFKRLPSICAYRVNGWAGGLHFYKFPENIRTNNGYYKRKTWISKNPSNILYLQESYAQYQVDVNNSVVSNTTYAPPGRHANLTGTNYLFYDGHIQFYVNAFPTAADVPFVMY